MHNRAAQENNVRDNSLRDVEIAEYIVQAAQATKAADILLYDMQNRSSITDYVLLCSGRSQAHVRGIADNIESSLKKYGVRSKSIEGHGEGSWVLMDYNVIIVHVFHPESRGYYDLESLLENFPCRRFDEAVAPAGTPSDSSPTHAKPSPN